MSFSTGDFELEFLDDGGSTVGRVEYAAVNDILRRVAEDRLAGTPGDVAHYGKLFPGREALVAKALGAGEAAGTRPAARIGGTLRRIGRYEILETLEGNLGRVYRAFDTELAREVVIKSVRRADTHNQQALRRFEREIRATTALAHPGICPAYDVVRHDDETWVVFPFIIGKGLDALLKQAAAMPTGAAPSGRLTALLQDESSGSGTTRVTARGRHGTADGPATCARLVARLAEAIHVAHVGGFVHRDLKPSNIRIRPDGSPVILDFGLAHETGAGVSPLTLEGDVLGTPSYMSPEQVRGDLSGIAATSDIYALGVILYELLTLERPFRAATRDGIYQRILSGEARRPRHLDREIPVDLEAVCMKAMDRRPERRYATADELAADLERFLDGAPVVAARITNLGMVLRRVRRHPYVAAASILALVAIVGFAMLADRHDRRRVAANVESVRDLSAYMDVDRAVRRGEPPPAAEWTLFCDILSDPTLQQLYRDNPDDEQATAAIKASIAERTLTRSGKGTVELLAPVGGVVGSRPTFRFKVTSPAARDTDWRIEIQDEFEWGEPLVILVGGDAAAASLIEATLPEGVNLATTDDPARPKRYNWSVRAVERGRRRDLSPLAEVASLDFHAVAPTTRDAALATVGAATPDVFRPLARAARLFHLDLCVEALHEVGRPVPDDPESSRRLRDITAAELNGALIEALKTLHRP